MLDACTVYAASGSNDDVFDPDTLTWTKATDDVVYNGACSINDATTATTRMDVDQGGQPSIGGRWTARILLRDRAVTPGSRLKVTKSRDKALVGREFRVTSISGGTFALTRTLALESITPIVRTS